MTFAVGHRVICTAFDWRPFTPVESESLNGAYGFVTHVENSLSEAMVFVQITGSVGRELEPDEVRKPWPFWERELQHAD